MAKTPFSFNIADELTAAFFWASLGRAEREQLKRQGVSTVSEVLAHVPKEQWFDLATHEQQARKKNFSESLSRHLATKIANGLRKNFTEILPDADGKGQESKARTARKYKRLDVNYSTPRLGLALGISIKTINARDAKSKKYSKNFSRIDGELRAEAADYHERQPYSVMIAVLFMPQDACFDSGKGAAISSFAKSVVDFRFRAGRKSPVDSVMLFECFFIALYDTTRENLGEVIFFDVNDPPPKTGLPKSRLSAEEVLQRIVEAYDERNNPPFKWDDGELEDVADVVSGEEDDNNDDLEEA